MPIKKKTILAGVTAILASIFAVSPGVAQAQDALEEIIVTAQKRAESIQDVPISMRALTGGDITAFDIGSSEGIADFIPNIQAVANDSGGHLNFYIRGIGTTNFHLNTINSVGVYLDDAAINNTTSMQFALFDIERVEVLRGPQNSLFGKNTTAGAITYISRKPQLDEDMKGHLDVTYGARDRIDVEAAFGMAVGPTAAFRVAAKTQNSGAWIENLNLGNSLGEREMHAGRASILWQPFDAMEINANVHIGINRGGNRPYAIAGSRDPANLASTCPGWPFEFIDDILFSPTCVDAGGFAPAPYGKSNASNPNLRNDTDTWGAVIKVDWDFQFATLTSISAFENADLTRSEDLDDGPDVLFGFFQQTDVNQWSQEFRLTSNADQRFRWILGVYWFFEESADTTVVSFPFTAFTAPGTPAPPGSPVFYPSTHYFQDDTALSIYGQAEWDFTDKLKLTVGLRGTWEEKEAINYAQRPNFTGILQRFLLGIPPALANPLTHDFDEGGVKDGTFLLTGLLDADKAINSPNRFGENWRNWGGRVALDYQWNEDLLLYASASRGFKGGGFSVAAFQSFVALPGLAVDPEILVTYEIGFKSDWDTAFGHVQFNTAAFWNNWKNQQVFSIFGGDSIPELAGQTLPILAGVPETESYGAELEAFWVPADGWFIQAGLGLLDSKVEDDTGLITISKGNQLPNAPTTTFTGLVRKEWPIGNGTLSLMTNFSYTGKQYFDPENSPNRRLDSYFLLDARGAYSFGPNERYTIAVSGKNLTDELYCRGIQSVIDAGGEVTLCTTNDEPLWALTASMNFE